MARIGQTVRILAVTADKDPKLLLVREIPSKENPCGVWKFPGGKMKFGKDNDLVDAAIREVVYEEILGLGGIVTRDMLDLKLKWKREVPSSYEGMSKRYLTIFPLILEKSVSIAPNPDSPEILGAEWVRFSRPPTKEKPIQGAPLAVRTWEDLIQVFTVPVLRKYFMEHGYDQSRMNGLMKSWRRLSRIPENALVAA